MPYKSDMHEENPDDTENKEDIIALDIKKVQSSIEDVVQAMEDVVQDNGKENNEAVSHEDDLTDDVTDDEDFSDRRKYPRSEFTYPAEFKIFSQNPEYLSFKGYLKDISISGACLQFEDKYGRFNIKESKNVKIKISFSIPHEEKVTIFAQIRWIKKVDPKTFYISLGIEFKDLEGWHLDVIEKLISMKNKDHNMMWNLWEQYDNNWR
ncbi:MAG: PilZ domain-containing protein [Nitrospirae bacterium]|nr:PilZ domain-containing protein [Nitrospirota bacterium]